jgi:hypothetical protein
MSKSVAPFNHSDFIYCLQTKLLVANYYLWAGQILEAKSWIGAASALAVYARLHQVGSSGGVSLVVCRLGGGFAGTLARPADDVERGEVVDAFWSVLATQRSFAMAVDPLDTGGDIDRGRCVSTPWPSGADDYPSVSLS